MTTDLSMNQYIADRRRHNDQRNDEVIAQEWAKLAGYGTSAWPLVAVQPTVQPAYTRLTNTEYSDLMTAMQVACGERSSAMPLSTVQVAAIRDLWSRMATLDVATAPYVEHTEAQLQAANDEVCDALAPAPFRTCAEYRAHVARMYDVSEINVSAYQPTLLDCMVLVYYPTFYATMLVRSDGTVAWLSIEPNA